MLIKELPESIYSGAYKSGAHVQGIAFDVERGYVYYSFTTMLLKTDIQGNPVGSVIKLAGHLGCITYDKEKNRVYGSLELKHDNIGSCIIKNTGWDPSSEDSFYLVSFDCEAIDRMEMDAENDGVMKAVYLNEVINDYNAVDVTSGKKHRYGCSGIDGTGLGREFGGNEKKIMIAYGIYSDIERTDNDYQVILQYDRDVIEKYGQPLNQEKPHHSGPAACEKRYFFYTGNTAYGVQNLEYDEYSDNWFLAVYRGQKPEFDNFPMFFIDASVAPEEKELLGRGGERGLVLTSAKLGKQGKQEEIYGADFPYGATGMASIGDGTFYFSHDGHKDDGFFTTGRRYKYDCTTTHLFEDLTETKNY